ncbi:hypothetical protein RY831_16460 [Noviherbaspirillum sp. CPCC 100848]|uniref:Uncharacterized protein n=1 Tax=Noviherbaspirillum album TaxID=3080276 RepID=A0ABU6JAU1_9BURK|nr:hypothetical protein [Noviherbaspirillum sp. CPCC 100848]MEC4720758.1 hypothetical protein [Noviherbaspirillum sp. CPCC 100848]
MAFKQIEEAEKLWRRIPGTDEIGPLLDGLPFKDETQMQDHPPEQQKLAA